MMLRSLQLVPIAFSIAFLAGCASIGPTGAGAGGGGDEPFAPEIQAFEEWDDKNAPPVRPVLFVGSSSIRQWETAESFPGLPVINRGFGGSQFSDLNTYLERLVLPYRPEVIVVYEGDNDIANGKTSQDVLDGFMEFVGRVHNTFPKTRIVYIPIKPSLARWELWPRMSEANMWIRDVTGRNPLLFYADLATPMLTTDGTPDPALFLEDGLHLNEAGYALWNEHLTPVLQSARRVPLP